MQRPHPVEGRAAPAHALGPAHRPDRAGDDAAQRVGRRRALALDHGEPEVRALDLADLAPVEAVEPDGAQEAVDRLVRRADPRAFPFLADIGLPLWQTLDAESDAARGREGPDTGIFEAGLLQPVGDEPLKVGARPVLHPGRNFLGQQFQQQFRHRRRPDRRCPTRPGCRATPGSRRGRASAPAGCRIAVR